MDVAMLWIPMQVIYVILLGNFFANVSANKARINRNECKITAPQYGSMGISAALIVRY